MSIDNATAFLEGFILGYRFRYKELSHDEVHQRRARERTLSAWWAYSRSATGQLAGCHEHGCYRCPSSKLMECPRSASIGAAREARLAHTELSYVAYQAQCALIDNNAEAIMCLYAVICRWG